jgi:hypothetical protein
METNRQHRSNECVHADTRGLSRKLHWPADLLFTLTFSIGFFLLLTATPNIPGADDGYRHVKFASRLLQDPSVAFSEQWKLLYFWPKPMDAWFGYHALLAPFTLVFDLITSAKIAASAIFGAITFILLMILKRLDITYRHLWVALAIAGSGMVLYRFTLTRPFLFSIMLVLLATHFTLREKPIAVGITSAIHALSYSMFFMAAFAPVMYFIIRRSKPAFKILAASSAGLILGLIANPTFPENIHFDVVDIFSTLMLGLRLTMELQPLNMEWINPSRPILAVWLLAVGRAIWQWRRDRLPVAAQLLLGMSLLAFAASVPVARTFDYFVPLAALASATVLSPWIAKTRSNLVDSAAVATVLAVLCGLNVLSVHRAMADVPAIARYRGVSEHLLKHGGKSVVFNTQWEQYPFLYFWNSQSTYVTGIEASMMYYHDTRRYWLWRHIANDEPSTCDLPQCTAIDAKSIHSTVVEDFGAEFVIVEHDKNKRLKQILLDYPGFQEVYRDQDCSLFTVSKAQASFMPVSVAESH